MEEKELITLTETVARSKGNSNQINEIKAQIKEVHESKAEAKEVNELKSEIKEIKAEQKAIFELSASIKVLVHEVSGVKDDVADIKSGQSYLNESINSKIDELDKRVLLIDDKGKVDFIIYFKSKILPFMFGGSVIGGIIYIIEWISK